MDEERALNASVNAEDFFDQSSELKQRPAPPPTESLLDMAEFEEPAEEHTIPVYRKKKSWCAECCSRRTCLCVLCGLVLVAVVVGMIAGMEKIIGFSEGSYPPENWLTHAEVEDVEFNHDNDTLILIDTPVGGMSSVFGVIDDLAAKDPVHFNRPYLKNETFRDIHYTAHAEQYNRATGRWFLYPSNFDCNGKVYTTRMAARCMERMTKPNHQPHIGFGFLLVNPILRTIKEFETNYNGFAYDYTRPVLGPDMPLTEDSYCNRSKATTHATCGERFTQEGGYGPPDSAHRKLYLSEYLACAGNGAFNRQARAIAAHVLPDPDQFIRTDATLLEEATQVLEGSLWFGLDAEFSKSMKHLAAYIDLPITKALGARPTEVLPDYVTPEELSLLQAVNAVDIELYHRAVRLFKTRYA